MHPIRFKNAMAIKAFCEKLMAITDGPSSSCQIKTNNQYILHNIIYNYLFVQAVSHIYVDLILDIYFCGENLACIVLLIFPQMLQLKTTNFSSGCTFLPTKIRYQLQLLPPQKVHSNLDIVNKSVKPFLFTISINSLYQM